MPSNPVTENKNSFDEVCSFVIELGTVAHGYGVSSYRLESYLDRVIRALGLRGEFMVTPTYINFIFWRQGEVLQRSNFSRMAASTFDMAKLARIGELVKQIEAGTLSMDEGVSRLKDVGKQPPLYGRWLIALGYALSSAGFAVLLSVAWRDVFLTVVLSLVVYAMALLAERSKWLVYTLEMSTAFVVSVLANAIAIFNPGSDSFNVTLCAVIVLIPGLALTMGLAEVTAKHFISGIIRFIGGIMITLKLFIGATIGAVIVNAVCTVPEAVTPPAIAPVWAWLFVVLLVVGLSINFQVRHKDLAWTILGGVLTYAGMVIGNEFGYWQGSFVGALMLGLYANLYAWRLQRPTSIVMLTAIMVLVPGASAYRGLQVVETSGVMSGVSAEWQVLVNIFAIIAGVLAAYSLVPPKVTM